MASLHRSVRLWSARRSPDNAHRCKLLSGSVFATLMVMTITTAHAQMSTGQMIETYFETAAHTEGVLNATSLSCRLPPYPEFLRKDLEGLAKRYGNDQYFKVASYSRKIADSFQSKSCDGTTLALHSSSLDMMNSTVKTLKQLVADYEAEKKR